MDKFNKEFNKDKAPSLQSVLASLLWSLGSLPSVPVCPRQRAIVTHQLRFVLRHPDTEPLMRDVADQLLVQFEDDLARRLQVGARGVAFPLRTH